MIYERNPVRCKFERRLEVRTSPLNIIYNPQAIKKVTEFFYKGRVHTSGEFIQGRDLAQTSNQMLICSVEPFCSWLMRRCPMSRFWLPVRAGAEGGRGCQEAVQQVEDANQGGDPADHRPAAGGRVHCESPLEGGGGWRGQTWLLARSFLDQPAASVFQENSKRWTMKLDISAPQVIFPDDFQSGDPMLVVLDLGRILLTNSQGEPRSSS